MSQKMAGIKQIKAVLIDLSGTLHIDHQVTPGAVEALKKLRSTDLRVQFVTNSTKESRRRLYEKLCKLGFELQCSEMVTTLTAAKTFIEEKSLKPMFLVDAKALEDFEGIHFEGEPNAVVVGLAPEHFNYEKLNSAFRLLMNGAVLIALNEGRYYMRSDGLAIGAGGFVKCLEYATGCKSLLIGKPEPDFFKSALNGIDVAEAIMIGDDVVDDIKGAQEIGMRGFLVQTGKYKKNDELKITPHPEKVVANFADAVDCILNEISKS